jgi:alpha-beta hydrolase superfamily lysophospholipase
VARSAESFNDCGRNVQFVKAERRQNGTTNTLEQEVPMSAMFNKTEGRLPVDGGLSIFYRGWMPVMPAKAIVVIVPGFNSHSGYYLDTGASLASRGFATYAVDLRGRGRSDGERFYVNTFVDYVADVEAIVAKARSEHPARPLFLLGHSAGGVVACLYALDRQEELAGLISESFAFQVPAPDFALAVFKGLEHIAPHAHVLHLRNEQFSRDPAMVQAMNDDPLIANETQPTRTLAELVRADERLKQEFPEMMLPLLILHGTADKAARASGSQLFYDTAGASDKTLKLYQGVFHDPLNDIGHEKVLSDITNWLAAHVA